MALIEDFSKFVKISISDSEPDLESTDDSQNESEELWTMGMLPPDVEKILLDDSQNESEELWTMGMLPPDVEKMLSEDILINSEELRGIPSYDEKKQLFNNGDEEDDLS